VGSGQTGPWGSGPTPPPTRSSPGPITDLLVVNGSIYWRNMKLDELSCQARVRVAFMNAAAEDQGARARQSPRSRSAESARGGRRREYTARAMTFN